MEEKEEKRTMVATITGGSGGDALISGLKFVQGVVIRAIVAMADSGGSSGRIRRSLDGALPPGDALKLLLALSDQGSLKRVLAHRLKQRENFDGIRHVCGLEGHTAGNALITAAQQVTGSFTRALEFVAELLGVHEHRVIPATLSHAIFCAEINNGMVLRGEHRVDCAVAGAGAITRAWFELMSPTGAIYPRNRPPRVTSEAKTVLGHTDVIVIGPGDFWSSIMQVLLIPGIRNGVRRSRVPVVFVLNATTKRGETCEWTAATFVRTIEEQIGRRLDLVLANDPSVLAPQAIEAYQGEGARPVEVNVQTGRRTTVIVGDFLSHSSRGPLPVRHDGKKVGETILEWLRQRTGASVAFT